MSGIINGMSDISKHPCFHAEAHCRFGRIHLPVAPRCNIRCRYCDRRYDCANESRPGVTSEVLSPKEALAWLDQVLIREPRICVAGIAGPGEPLYNDATFETFRMIHQKYPRLLLCVSTNGLLLEKKLDELIECGISTLTVTVNTLRPESAARIYHFTEAQAENFLRCQQQGIRRAVSRGMITKINTVLIPGINENEAEEIAKMGNAAGAVLMNLMPLIPCGELKKHAAPSPELLLHAREHASAWLAQFTLCRQCRADACGIPGRER